MDGLEATRRIRNGENPLGRTIPILAMTANAFLEDMQKSKEAGMDEHTLPVTGILQHREGKSDRRLTAPAMDVQGQACTEAIVALRRHDMLGFTVNKLLVKRIIDENGLRFIEGSRTGKTKSSSCNTFPTFRASSSTKKRPTTTESSAAASPKNASRRS